MISLPVLNHLATLFNCSNTELEFSGVGGGSINQSFRIHANKRETYFCKINSATKFPHLFTTEKNGLELLAQQQTIITPEVVDCFIAEDQQVLLLRWIESGEQTNAFWKLFGEQLAALHSVTSNTFGLDEENYMGSVPQLNTPMDNWIQFFTECRLQPLFKKCLSAGLLTSRHIVQFERLIQRLPQIFNAEKPSLVHGDLWSGNFMCNKKEQPMLIDPAVYYGHRSVDLAMTTLFGGFDKGFYESYRYHKPFPHNYKEQWEVCNLYPLLIHLLLFGRTYLYQIEEVLKAFQ